MKMAERMPIIKIIKKGKNCPEEHIPAKTVVRMRIAKAAKEAIVPGGKQGPGANNAYLSWN
jgi:hypothetical protein